MLPAFFTRITIKIKFCSVLAPPKPQAEQEESRWLLFSLYFYTVCFTTSCLTASCLFSCRFSFRHSASVSSLGERLVVWMTNVGKVFFVTFHVSLKSLPWTALPNQALCPQSSLELGGMRRQGLWLYSRIPQGWDDGLLSHPFFAWRSHSFPLLISWVPAFSPLVGGKSLSFLWDQ